jgi:membrane-associated phospholipid phosphatase
MFKKIEDFDIIIWKWINQKFTNSIFDVIFPVLRNPFTWIPLYLFLAIFIPYKFGKKGFLWCLFFVMSFGIGDYTSASIIKPFVKRLRPCNDANLEAFSRIIVDCGSGFSFPSSHATNHFALAVFSCITLGEKWSWIRIPFMLWAFFISYAQVYVGVHFPLDITIGALLGTLIGFFVGKIFNAKISIVKK